MLKIKLLAVATLLAGVAFAAPRVAAPRHFAVKMRAPQPAGKRGMMQTSPTLTVERDGVCIAADGSVSVSLIWKTADGTVLLQRPMHISPEGVAQTGGRSVKSDTSELMEMSKSVSSCGDKALEAAAGSGALDL